MSTYSLTRKLTMDYEKLTLIQAVRRWSRLTIISLCLCLDILLWGYDTAIQGNLSSMPKFKEVFGVRNGDTYIIDVVWISLWAISAPLGSMTGALAGGWIQDWRGRKSTQLLGAIFSIAAVTTCYLSDTAPNKQATFWGGQYLEGIAVGMLVVSTQTWLSEVVPARLRGPALAMFPILTLFGQLIAAIVAFTQVNVPGKTSYRTAIISQYPLSVIPFILAFVLPESPVWLIRKGKMDLASTMFKRIHSMEVAASHQDLFDDMVNAINKEKEGSHEHKATYAQIFRGTNLRRTFITMFAYSLQELWGLTLLGSVSYFLQLVGLDADAAFIVLILGVVLGLLANIASFWTLLKFGRRLLLLVTLSLVALFWITMGIAGCFPTKNVAYYVSAAMMAIVVTAGVGAWPGAYVIASETSSLRLRSKTTGIGWMVGGLFKMAFGVAAPYLYNPDAGNLGGKTGFVYAGTTIFAVTVTWFVVPEMKGLSTIEIDRMFERKISARSAQKWKKSLFESVGSIESNGGETPLHTVRSQNEPTRYDSGSSQSISVEHAVSKGTNEPSRE